MEKYRINQSEGMEFGLYSLGDHIMNPLTGSRISAQERIKELIEMSKLAEQAGIDVFSVGESHQTYFISQAHTVILSAIAQATTKIKIASSATVLSVLDPVRLFEDFATIDLISNGRAEIVAGRGSRVGAHQLLGVDLQDYEEIYEEKLELLKQINENERVTWQGKFRTPLENAEILPRPLHGSLPIWRAVGGPPASAIKAGYMGIPMMLTTLGGPAMNFKPSVLAYRRTAEQSGFNPDTLPIATTSLFYVADTTKEALQGMYPHLNVGFQAIRGTGYPKQQFAQAPDYRDALMVGSTEQVIEKLLYQYELFGMQRFVAQIDFGGVPFDKMMKNIEIIGNDIIPAIKKHTRK
ncbi:LLM class flavin-dependent oxidoreductase [Pseudogracilibacillus auburnensis]|uniref:Alkanesulfonate monooxygenase SsuD/methylene tetrahydromethanopterin reductase-like flavin-dependent oxidoreductase (Luciferase family) n=1 Tax=Pseudogracilibacillus auburnensis TaxID=1494959 RepID=A0A2V3W1D6_9BACI|nr:LLM class flavin-dependent oxidoreductase [Pseudogracilibacillus auburnensis]PXW88087.1 alkanesulfonate monooxygenase SsuD/methylene tetrahydromethanopterin reductase-like flavin-dependent oxidoreductase (luciferase family) [Pseudogracilibacillus auburnensis]